MYRGKLHPIWWVSGSALALSFIIILLDKGPPIPPFKNGFSSFDCHGMKLLNSEISDGKVKMQLQKSESIEYPPEYQPNFVNLRIDTGDAHVEYSGRDLAEFSNSALEMNMTFAHPFAGQSHFDLSCANVPLGLFESDVPEFQLDKSQPYSYGSKPGLGYIQWNHLCLENTKILFFTKARGTHRNIAIGSESIVVEFLNMKTFKYLDQKHVSWIHPKTALISNLSASVPDLILFSLPPLVNLARSTQKLVSLSAPDAATKKLLKLLNLPEPVNRNDIMCFENLAILDTNKHITDQAAVRNAFAHDYSAFRKYLRLERNTVKGKVVIPKALENRMKSCENCTMEVVDDDDFFTLRNVVSDAHILVVDGVLGLAPLVLMKAGSHVVDVSETPCAWKREFCERNGASYHTIHRLDASDSCYGSATSRFTNDDVQKLEKIIEMIMFE